MRIAVIAAALAMACATPVPIRFGTHAAAPVVAFSSPSFADGDPIAGRRTFIDLRCIDCHRVAEDPELPEGRGSMTGPLLSAMNQHPPRYIADRITSRQTGANVDLFDRTMKDYAQPMSARQLVDVVAYLRNPKPPRG
jgi:cytochrome c553